MAVIPTGAQWFQPTKHCRGHSFENYDLHLSITKYQNLNSEVSKTRIWLKVCVLSQQHEIVSLSPEHQVHNLPPYCKYL